MPAPTKLGPYQLGKPLGKGGMGTVYRATNTETGEQVAIKTLAPELASSEGFRERFEAEIESLRTLSHKNVVRLFGFGEEDGVLFYSMELVDGVSLDEELKQGRRFNWREVIQIAVQVSRALKHAHDHGIIHRDIKPANILQSGDSIKLADFGIAQLFGGAKLTTARGVVGTADYMSPEQAESRPITDRCDQYSLGCVMYALLAGRPPFRAKGLPEMLQLQRYAEPEPVCRFAPDTPKQLEKVVMQLLEKSPRDRFPSALALARHLEAMNLALSRTKLDESDFLVRSDEQETADPRGEPNDQSETPAEASKAADYESQYRETVAPPTRGPSDMSIAELSERQSEAGLAGQPRFTIVEEGPLAGTIDAHPLWLQVLQGVLLLGLIIALGIGLMWGMRSPSADELYERIQHAAAEGGETLIAEDDAVSDFLVRFPGDPRFAEVEQLSQQLEFAKAERRMMAMLRRRAASDAPLESLYLEAMRDAKDNPERANKTLLAMIGLMAGKQEEDLEESVSVMLRLARDQSDQLQTRIDQRAKVQLPFLLQRLSEARVLASDNPADARDICRSMVLLYSDLSWAAPVVNDARRLLSQLDERQ